MVVKRALVVDDSKSARAFLIRLLAEQQVEVDSADTAEKAIEYLEKQVPDVIFMDHLMPGMDGFQAVQAIKANPRTAGIPIMMYTSQEGELYLGQARALGAVGVLPKSVSPADVRMVLQQLQLEAQPAPLPAAAADVPAGSAVARVEVPADVPTIEMPAAEVGPAMNELVRDELAALRRHVADALTAHREQVLQDLRNLIQDAAPANTGLPPILPGPPPVMLSPDPPRQSPVPWLLALAAGIGAAVFGTLWWQGEQRDAALRAELMDSRSTVALLAARLGSPGQPAADSTTEAADTLVLQVPFGEVPLAGERIEALRDFVARVAALQRKGKVEVRRHAGRFCLAGNSESGFALAAAEAPSSGCTLVADATDPQQGMSEVESEAFGKALADLRRQHAALLTIEVMDARGDAPRSPYPETGGGANAPTAAEWNAVAEDNNRVEIRWLPAT